MFTLIIINHQTLFVNSFEVIVSLHRKMFPTVLWPASFAALKLRTRKMHIAVMIVGQACSRKNMSNKRGFDPSTNCAHQWTVSFWKGKSQPNMFCNESNLLQAVMMAVITEPRWVLCFPQGVVCPSSRNRLRRREGARLAFKRVSTCL